MIRKNRKTDTRSRNILNKEKKYVIECNEKQLQLIDQALRTFARITTGQFQIGFDEAEILLPIGYKIKDPELWTESQKKWLIELETNPELNIMWGHTDNSEAVWDMHQVIRHLFWKENPKRICTTVDSNVTQMGEENLIEVKRKDVE